MSQTNDALVAVLADVGALLEAGQRLRAVALTYQHTTQELHVQNAALVAALVALDTATTQVGDHLAELADQVKTDMTPDEVAAVVQSINAESERLKTFATDPANPVPPVVAAPPATA